jgi:hypothetical protein
MPVYKQLRVRTGYSKTSHHDFWQFLANVYKRLVNNPNFPKPPVNLAKFKAKIDEYWAKCSETMGRATLAFAERNSLREELNKMFLLLAAYVDHEADGDEAKIATSGMETLPTKRAAAQPLDRPGIPRVGHGNRSGEIKVWMPVSLRKIRVCFLQYVAIDDNDAPVGEWTEMTVASFQGPVIIGNLKPGTRYAFQVCALGTAGKTDWSNSAIKMCT